MRKVTLYVILAFMVAPIFVSCYQSHKKELGVAYALAETEPDSALAFLNHIEQRKLSEEDMAKYALIYYKGNDLHGMAQIIIAKHRKGSVGDVLLNFRGEFTRFQDPQDAAAAPVEEGGEIVGSRMNGGGQDGSPLPPPPAENLPF